MDRQQWLKWRKIGSSDAPVLMGVSPWMTPYQWHMDRLLKKEKEDNPSMKRGREMEEPARKCLESMTGLLLVPTNLESKKWNFMTASLDGYDEDNKMIAEIKCPGKEDHGKAKAGKIPDKYWPQVQHQLEVAELEKMFYFSFDGKDGVIVNVNRDDAYIKKMVQVEAEAWDRLLTQTPPNKSLKDEPYEESSDDIDQKFLCLREFTAQRKEWEAKEEILRKEIIDLSQGKNIKFHDGSKLYQSLVKGSVQYDQIPELQTVNLDQYRKEPYLKWTLRFN